MHDIRKIDVMEGIMDENDAIAEHIKDHMGSHGVLVVNEMGAPGAGKTTVIKNIVKCLKTVKPYVIEGDIESDIDTQDLNSLGIETYQINTFGACHLDAPMVDHMIDHMGIAGHHGHHHDEESHGEEVENDHLINHQHAHVRDHAAEHLHEHEHDAAHAAVKDPSILFIENVGNLVCPAEFSIGEHVKMLVSTVTEGSDKPYKYPLAFEKADLIILNKVDLIPYLDFDEERFMRGIRALNKEVPVFKVSGRNGEGFEEIAAWLEEKAAAL